MTAQPDTARERTTSMSLSRFLTYALSHPLARKSKLRAFFNIVRWQLRARWSVGLIRHNWIGDTCLMARRGMTGATGNIYYGLHEFQEMAFLIHLLRSEDCFIDIGANIGSYSILASGVCGARSISFEPDPGAFSDFETNIGANQLVDRVMPINKAVGAHPGELEFTVGLDTMNRAVGNAGHPGPTQIVPVCTLDSELNDVSPTFLKVDVEGFESAVIQGALATLAKPSLVALMLETVDSDVARILAEQGFVRCTYDPFTRALSRSGLQDDGGNQLFVRDMEFVSGRLVKARSVRVLGVSV